MRARKVGHGNQIYYQLFLLHLWMILVFLYHSILPLTIKADTILAAQPSQGAATRRR
jgi:hypothetical protein